MTPIPQISKAARNALMKWGLANMPENLYAVFCKELAWFALSPSDDLDAVRARFQPKTRKGYEYVLYEEFNGKLYGRVRLNEDSEWEAETWDADGMYYPKEGPTGYDLLPISPHAALIAELREQEDRCYHGGMDDTARLFKRAADALEAIEVQK